MVYWDTSCIYEKAREKARKCYHLRRPIPLRTLDGLHLATALVAKLETIVTTDQRMSAAARLLGLQCRP